MNEFVDDLLDLPAAATPLQDIRRGIKTAKMEVSNG